MAPPDKQDHLSYTNTLNKHHGKFNVHTGYHKIQVSSSD